MNSIAIILIVTSFKAYKRTKKREFSILAFVLLIFVVADVTDVVLNAFYGIDLDFYGYHEIATIVLLLTLFLIFSPVWKKQPKIKPEKERLSA